MPIPRASMGFVGSVTFANIALVSPAPAFSGNVTVRATSADIRAAQEITRPNVVDGRMDMSLYQLGARTVEGSIAFPLVHEGSGVNSGRTCGTSVNHGQLFWALASQRDQFGRLQYGSMQVRIRYTDDTAFIYPNCLIDSVTMNVVQEGTVDMNMKVIGGANSSDNVREVASDIGEDLDFLAPARVVTWNDFAIRLYGDESVNVPGDYIRQFEVTLNNNAKRFYTLNNRLAPQDIAAGKREIQGRLVLMGRHPNLSELAYNNQKRFTSNSKIAFGYKLGANGTPVFATVLNGVIFQIEEIAITNDLVETTIPFMAHADCDANYEATEIGAARSLPSNTPTPGTFGGPTAPGFPQFRIVTDVL